MDDAGAVRAIEGVGDLRGEAQNLGDRKRSASDSPSSSSVTRYPSPTSKSVQMFR